MIHKRMRGLTLWQPWASLVAIGVKNYETRSWKTDFRGLLAIHAAKRRPVYMGGETEKIMLHELNAEGIGWMELPLGAFVATCQLIDCFPVEDLWPELRELENEQHFGNWGAGRFAWALTDIRRVDPPLKHSGNQGLWYVPMEKAKELRKLTYP